MLGNIEECIHRYFQQTIMKKVSTIVLFNLLVFLTQVLVAQQIPIMRNDYNPSPQPGTTMNITRINSGAISQGASGASITWNFAALATENVKTGTFVLPNATPYSASFPNANIAIAFTPGIEYGSYTANYEFFNISNASLTKNGFVNNASTPIAVNYSDPKTLMPFPFTFGNAYTDNFAANYTSSTFDVNENGTFTITADGYGTLILPYGTIQNMLRVRIVETMTQTITGFDPFEYQIETYAWYHPKLVYPFFSITSEIVNGSPQPSIIARYIQIPGFDDSLPDIVGIPTAPIFEGITLYPNPTQGNTQLALTLLQSAQTQISLYSMNGQMAQQPVNDFLPSGNYRFDLDVSTLPKGLYLVSITTNSHQQTAKLMVQ